MISKKAEKALIWVFILLVLGAIILYSVVHIFGNKVVDVAVSERAGADNPALEKYRSIDLPEECRLPSYEADVSWWKEHLSHHGNTQFCSEYYSDIN